MRANLEELLHLAGVGAAVERARDACVDLRRHPALRRQGDAARAEALVRAAAATAALDGARLPLRVVRDAARGAGDLPDDPTGRAVRGALRVVALADRFGAAPAAPAPAQVIARLHAAAAAGLVPDEALGRPRRPGEAPRDGGDSDAPAGAELAARLRGIQDLLAAGGPALVVAALVHAELAVVRPFSLGSAMVGRAAARVVAVRQGLDPTGVAVWEAGLLAVGPGFRAALAGYAEGGADGVRDWLLLACQSLIAGVEIGREVCDAVAAGRLPPD